MSTDALATPMPEGGSPRVEVEELPDLPAEGVERLTQQQRRAVQLLLDGRGDAAVARVLQVPTLTVARWRREELATALDAGEREELEQARRGLSKLTRRAVRELRRVMDETDAPAGSRCRAATVVLEYAEKLAQLRAGKRPASDRLVRDAEDPVQLARRVVRVLGAAGMTPGEIAALATQEAK